MIKLILRATLLAAILMAFTAIANADTLVSYSTQGCFGALCVPAPIASNAVGAGTLVYAGQLPEHRERASGGFTAAQLGTFTWLGAPRCFCNFVHSGDHPDCTGTNRFPEFQSPLLSESCKRRRRVQL